MLTRCGGFGTRLATRCTLLLAASLLHGQTPEPRLPPEYFESPGRAAWQKPDEIVAKLELKPGLVVGDIGAGSGYFTRRFARAVSPGGIVYAVDIDERMLRFLHAAIEKEDLHSIVPVLAATNDPMLPPGAIDLVFICDTYHHFTNRADYLARIRRSLKPGGRLVIVDIHKKPLPIHGPPIENRLAREVVIRETAAAGFALLQEFDFLPYQYFLVLGLPRPAGSAP